MTYKWHSYGSRVAGNVVDNQEIRQTCLLGHRFTKKVFRIFWFLIFVHLSKYFIFFFQFINFSEISKMLLNFSISNDLFYRMYIFSHFISHFPLLLQLLIFLKSFAKNENKTENENGNSIRNSFGIQIVSFALIGSLVCCCRYPPTADWVCECVCVFSPQVSTVMQSMRLLLLPPAEKTFLASVNIFIGKANKHV